LAAPAARWRDPGRIKPLPPLRRAHTKHFRGAEIISPAALANAAGMIICFLAGAATLLPWLRQRDAAICQILSNPIKLL
jgi:hypothetical protein